ncbi:transcriptional regulator, partial [Streptomyces sp. SID2131]|nr:transcriptional regulator [Streptomyces sp. SID2131]
AEALLGLGDLPAAHDHAVAAVGAPSHDRGRVHRLAMLCRVQLRQGEADGAARTAVEMTERARGMESRRLRDRLREVREHLLASDAADAREAAALIDGALRVPL